MVLLNGKLGDGEEDVLTRFGSVSGPENTGIVLMQVKNQIAENWFKVAGKSLSEVQGQINHATKPQSFAFPISCTFRSMSILKRRVPPSTTCSRIFPAKAMST